MYFDQGSDIGEFVLLAANVVDTEYQISGATVTPGETYSFKFTARNTVGDSLESDVL